MVGLGTGDPSPTENKKQARFRGPVGISLFFLIQSSKELVVTTLINFPQFNEYAGADVQFSRLILGVCGSANIASTALKFGTELLLRDPGSIPQSAQIIAHIAVTPDFLFHFITPAILDQYWLQLPLFYAIISLDIDRYTGQVKMRSDIIWN